MSLNEALRRVEDARAEFRAALADAADRWEAVVPGSWSPREIAEHVMGAELGYAGAVASATGLTRPAWETFACTSADAALLRHAQVANTSRAILGRVTEEQLESVTPSGETVAHVLERVAAHLEEHSRQLRNLQAVLG